MAIDTAADVATLFATAEHAVAATYTPTGGPAISTEVIIDRDLEIYRPDGYVLASERQTVILLQVPDVATSKRGDTVLAGATTYTVDEVIEDDGAVRAVVVR